MRQGATGEAAPLPTASTSLYAIFGLAQTTAPWAGGLHAFCVRRGPAAVTLAYFKHVNDTAGHAGYFFSRPIEAEALAERLAQQAPVEA